VTRVLAFVVLIGLTSPVLANTTPQTLPFSQDWSNNALITTTDDWSGVPGIVGFLGQDGSTMTGGIDPRNVLGVSSESDDLSVLANQTATTSTVGDVAEFQLTNSVVALQGSGTADSPYLLITLDTTGVAYVRVRYNLRDIDGSGDNAAQQVALQYRLGTTGSFTNVPAAFVADASSGPNLATLVTAVDVTLSEIGNQSVVQLRVITGNAVGSDEWIGIDDIQITNGTTNPSGVGMSSPASALRNASLTLTAAITAGNGPASTSLAVTCDLSSIGGSATQALLDDGQNGDGFAGDNIFTFAGTVGSGSTAGAKSFPCTVGDAQSRSSSFNIAFTVLAECGDGVIEGSETCDDDDPDGGDGCSASCTIEPGYECNGTPSTCSDLDECTLNTDNCSANADCTNIDGGFTCACKAGFSGDGVTCTDIDECAGTNNCSTNALCMNLPGNYTCVCGPGYTGDGRTTGTGCTDVDECGTNTDLCIAEATCNNTPGNYACACPPGYAGDGRSNGTGCTDVNECTANTDNCDTNAMCTNTPGSFTCACNGGYTGNGVTCADIDECTANSDDCIGSATCNNTTGSFTCTCPSGYSGDGKASGTGCTDVDECTANTDNCDANANCANTAGSFTCACKPGFTGSGTACSDVDECGAGSDNCDANASCENTAGSFECVCKAGFSGDGTSCVANCGDGAMAAPEACDDGNTSADDGCSPNCAIEDGFECTGAPSICEPTCGDGLRVADEACDDGNGSTDDGCDAYCAIEDGWTCSGEPSTCEPPPDGGCCSSSTDPSGVALLVMIVIAGLRRRHRG
jgi:cysteine-rich repeat protein